MDDSVDHKKFPIAKAMDLTLAIFVMFFLLACGSPSTPIPGPLETAQAYLKRGDAYSEIQDYDDAIMDYNQAIHLKPEYVEAYNNRGYA